MQGETFEARGAACDLHNKQTSLWTIFFSLPRFLPRSILPSLSLSWTAWLDGSCPG